MQSIIRLHLRQYLTELQHIGAYLGSHSFHLNPMPLSGDLRWKEQIVPVLYSAVGLTERTESAQLFSGQLCWFKANANPFSKCAYSECYQIQDTPTDEKWYAFLPIHPDYRKSCLESGMAGSVRMRLVSEENRKWIHVTMTHRSPEGYTTEVPWDYFLTEGPSTQERTAVPLGHDTLDIDTWPTLAVLHVGWVSRMDC